MGNRKKAALFLLGGAAISAVCMTSFDVLLLYVPFITAALSSVSVYLWVTAT